MMQKIWLDTFVSQKDFVIVVGENKLGRVEFNLKEYPHTLIDCLLYTSFAVTGFVDYQ